MWRCVDHPAEAGDWRLTKPTENEITRILAGLREESKPAALDRLLPLVYGELRALAKAHLRSERSDHTLQATALVHERYCQLEAVTGSLSR